MFPSNPGSSGSLGIKGTVEESGKTKASINLNIAGLPTTYDCLHIFSKSNTLFF